MNTRNTVWGKYTLVASVSLCIVLISTMLAYSAQAQETTDTPPPPPPAEVTTTPPPSDPQPTPSTSEVPQTESQAPPVADPAPGGDAQVTTGDASASSGSGNDVNTIEASSPSTASTTIANTNNAEVGNAASSTAETGDNAAVSSGGSASVSTGDAIASANVINVVNTNIVNSPGILAFLNFIFGGGFDFRNFDLSYFFGGASPSSGCSFSSCNNGSLNVSNNNDATITNSLIVRANTGGNLASTSGDGSASVSTGDAYASANVFNLINTNFINSNYLLVSFNNFGDMAGDLTLPGADFFTQLLSRSGTFPRTTTIENNNTATVNNSTSAHADTGSNTASTTGDGSATVTTGNANAAATTYNQVNTNLVGGTRVFMLINVIGDWSGSVFGLPQGMSWIKTPTGVALMSDEVGAGEGSGTGGLSSLFASNTNNATVNNDVQVWALTGQNKAQGGEGGANISTGDAYASANVVNIVNTNVIGQNWLFAIFNIFGNWSGNFSFGRPDLWIGAVAETGNPTAPGDTITYRFTVSNKGDADATGVSLKALFDSHLLGFEMSDIQNEDGVAWNLGTIAKGATKEFIYKAKAGDIPSGAVVEAPLTATLASNETDNNLSDNTERLSIIISAPSPSTFAGNASPGAWTSEPAVSIVKTASVATTTLPASVDYKIVVTNTGGPAYNTILTDTLEDAAGDKVFARSWNLDTIAPDDEITLTYTVNYDVEIDPGLYKNTARITGQKGNSVAVYAVDMKPVEASHLVELKKGEGEVLGAETQNQLPLACAAYITSYIKPGVKNNNKKQVERLQFFLRDFENMRVETHGTYDEATIAAVKAFQKKYADEILAPWGDVGPSGFVYYTTQKKINELYCQGISQFPLSSNQMNHILSYRGSSMGNLGFVANPKIPDMLFPEIDLSPFFLPTPEPSPMVSESVEPPSLFEVFLRNFLSLGFGMNLVQAKGF